jgi:hypothetical protein
LAAGYKLTFLDLFFIFADDMSEIM